jgi:hypothetical protein
MHEFTRHNKKGSGCERVLLAYSCMARVLRNVPVFGAAAAFVALAGDPPPRVCRRFESDDVAFSLSTGAAASFSFFTPPPPRLRRVRSISSLLCASSLPPSLSLPCV